MPNFSFGASAYPSPNSVASDISAPRRAPGGVYHQQPNLNGMDMSPLIAAMAQAMQGQAALAPGKQRLQSGALFGRHLGIGGAEMSPENPTGNPMGDGIDWLHAHAMSQPQIAAQQSQMPMSAPPTPQDPMTYGMPTHQIPYQKPAPRQNPFDDANLTMPNGNPRQPARRPGSFFGGMFS